MRPQTCGRFHHADRVLLYRLSHLLKGTQPYLTHALARDAELVG